MKNLATIQRVTNVRNHPNGEKLDLVQVLGWQVVTKRGEYKDGDLCVYVVIDTILPEKPEFEFLRNKNFRIKPIRLRGEESAGIAFPLSVVPGYCGLTAQGDGFFFNRKDENGLETHGVHEVGDDVAELIGVTKYEKPISPELAGQAVGHFPPFLIITDEDNLRSYPDAVPELYGRAYYITRKEDGSSGTYFQHGGEFGVCSRRIHLKESEGNGFWRIAHKYNIQEALRKAFPERSIAIQGEVVGPGVQKNPIGLTELSFRLFNIFDIQQRSYLDYEAIVKFTTDFGIPMVPIVAEGTAFGYSLEELVKLAREQKYGEVPGEGIVIRPKESFYSSVLKKSWSGKVINELYKEE
jgi:RNA ligase (TIGR02306 family)